MLAEREPMDDMQYTLHAIVILIGLFVIGYILIL